MPAKATTAGKDLIAPVPGANRSTDQHRRHRRRGRRSCIAALDWMIIPDSIRVAEQTDSEPAAASRGHERNRRLVAIGIVSGVTHG